MTKPLKGAFLFGRLTLFVACDKFLLMDGAVGLCLKLQPKGKFA